MKYKPNPLTPKRNHEFHGSYQAFTPGTVISPDDPRSSIWRASSATWPIDAPATRVLAKKRGRGKETDSSGYPVSPRR